MRARLLVLAAALGLAACASFQVDFQREGRGPGAAKDVEQVQAFASAKDVPFAFEPIGRLVLDVQGMWPDEKMGGAEFRLRSEAALRGADGIIIEERGTPKGKKRRWAGQAIVRKGA